MKRKFDIKNVVNKAKSFRLPKSTLSLQDRLPFIVAFLAPILIMIGIFIQRGIWPFGDKSFLRTDLYHQYAPFMAEFLRKLRSGEDLLWTWNIGIGSNFVSLMAYYLASPLNWLVILCPPKYIIEFITFWVVVKIGLSSLTFSYYLSKRYKTRNFAISFFGILYSLSAYMAAYSWNIMWLDCIFLAPLILLGLERLMKEDKCFLYCITLALAIISNYYIAMMICMFLVLYFIVLLFDRSYTLKQLFVRVFNFGLYSLLAGCMAGVFLLPAIMALGTTASAGSTFPKTFSSYFSMFEMLARHMVNLPVETGLDHWPNFYCGVVVFLLVPMYVMNKKIPYREKITRFCLLFFLLISFSTNQLNFIWHGFHYPNSLPCRQSFLYVAIMLCMCFEAIHKIEHGTRAQIVGSLWGSIAFILLCEEFVTDETIKYHNYLVTAIFIGIYALLVYLYKRKKAAKSVLAILSLTVIVAESAMNTGITSVTWTNRTSYWKNTDSMASLTEQMKEENDNTFFRIEKYDSLRKTKNDGTWVGFPSASIFSSTTHSQVTSLYKEWGMEGSTNAYCFRGSTPLTSALLSVKYMYSTDKSLETNFHKLVATEGEISMYESTYWLPLGFMMPADILETWDYKNGNDIGMQNNLIKAATGIASTFELFENVTSTSTKTLEVKKDGYYYTAVHNSSVEKYNVNYVFKNPNRKDKTSVTFNDGKRSYILNLGWLEAGDSFTISASDSDNMSLSIFRLNEEKFADAMEIMGSQPLVVDKYTSSTVSGHITCTEDGMMYTSIPYEKGWSVYVDGAPVKTQAFANTMLMIPLTKGEHTIEMRYRPEGLTEGLIISAVALLCFALLVYVNYTSTKTAKQVSSTNASAANTTPVDTAVVRAALAEHSSETNDEDDTLSD